MLLSTAEGGGSPEDDPEWIQSQVYRKGPCYISWGVLADGTLRRDVTARGGVAPVGAASGGSKRLQAHLGGAEVLTRNPVPSLSCAFFPPLLSLIKLASAFDANCGSEYTAA